jgi:hypothetical protein
LEQSSRLGLIRHPIGRLCRLSSTRKHDRHLPPSTIPFPPPGVKPRCLVTFARRGRRTKPYHRPDQQAPSFPHFPPLSSPRLRARNARKEKGSGQLVLGVGGLWFLGRRRRFLAGGSWIGDFGGMMNSSSGAGPSNGGSGDGDTPRRTSRKPKCEISFFQSLTLQMLLIPFSLLYCSFTQS